MLAALSSLLWLTAAAEPQDKSTQLKTDSPSQEIIVIGERVPKTLRDTSSSVVVVTADQIDSSAALDRIDQILQLIPNVQLGGGSQGPAIRGLDTTGPTTALPAFLGGNRPRTTIVVDGRPVGYNEFVFGISPVWDINHIEVYRSPQTTTQGQNSIAGAIFVYSNHPSFETGFRARAIGGNLETRQISAAATGPLIRDQLAYRVAGDFRYSRTASKIGDNAVGADPNHDVFGLLRAKILAVPTRLPGSRFELTYAHTQSQMPQIETAVAPFRKRRDPTAAYGTFRTNIDAVTLTAGYDPTDAFHANATVTGGDSDVQRFAPQGLGQAKIAGRDSSAELIIRWAPRGPVKLTAGLSSTNVRLRQFIDLSALAGIGQFHDFQTSGGVFGELNIELSEATKLTAGARYQSDRQKRSGRLGSGPTAIDLDFDRRFHAWLPKLSIAHDFGAEVTAGLLVQKAYNPGGTTLRFDTGPDNFDAETLWDYEVFARANLLQDAVHVSANVFYYDIRNAQRADPITVITPNGRRVGFADLFNVPRAHSYGMEAAIDWRVSRRLSVSLAIGLLDTRITKVGEANQKYDGKQFGRAPNVSGSASIEWKPFDDFRLSSQLRHHSRYFSDDLNGPDTRVAPSTVMDARAEWDIGRSRLFGYARNLFDKFYVTTQDAKTATVGDPREIGLGFESRF